MKACEFPIPKYAKISFPLIHKNTDGVLVNQSDNKSEASELSETTISASGRPLFNKKEKERERRRRKKKNRKEKKKKQPGPFPFTGRSRASSKAPEVVSVCNFDCVCDFAFYDI